MRKIAKRLGTLMAGLWIVAASVMQVCAEEGYTYNYDYWGDVQYSPDAYAVAGVYTAADLGLDMQLSSPSGMYVHGSMIYICDTGNNRILELERVNTDTIVLRRIIDHFQGDPDNAVFSGPSDIALTDDGYMYICDKNNGRILKLDLELNYCMEFSKPVDATFDQSLSFLPDKLAVDSSGRVYCVATNVNKGLIKYEADGEFSGFVGATEVTYDWVDYIWKKFATREQRAQMKSFVPTEYDNVYMDHEGFLYACTVNVSEADLRSLTAAPIRRLNLMGKDILIRNGDWYVMGDIYWDAGGGYEGPSLITDITALENGVYVALDKVRGRLFAYDDQGRMLYAFGGMGNVDGYFRQPVAVEHMGHDLLVLDSLDRSITVFTPTEFGSLIFEAIEQFQGGAYYESGETWRKVLVLNGNYDLAYIGIGRSLLRQERYEEAMAYFKSKLDEENYSKAYKQYRKLWVEAHIAWIFLLAFLVLCVPLFIGRMRKIKHEIDTAEIFRRERGSHDGIYKKE